MIVDDLFENNKKKLDEVDPRNFDSDVDYYAAQNAPAKRRSAPSDYPYSQQDDDAYFNDIFRKKREAAKKAEQDKESGVAESEHLDELSFKDIQRGANKFAKGANKFTKNVADTGAAVGNAAGALGGAVKQVGKTAIADPVSAAYNATKSGLNKAAGVAANTYNDVKSGVQKVGQAGATVGTDLGNAAKAVGRGAANVAGGTAGGLGAVAGGATTGLGRAAAQGFNTGVQNVGGDAVDRLQTNVMARRPKEIKTEIETKKNEIENLEAELAKSIATTGGQAERPWAVSSVNPATGKQWTPGELQSREIGQIGRNMRSLAKATAGKANLDTLTSPEKLAALAQQELDTTPPSSLPAATTAQQPYGVTYGQGFNKQAAPKPTAVPNYGRQSPGYNYTTSVTPTAAPAGTKVTTGGATAAEKAALDKRIAAAAQAQPVAETVKQVKRMMETVTSRADVQRIKDYIDYHMGSNLTESAQLKRNRLLSEVTQLAATRRREIASRIG